MRDQHNSVLHLCYRWASGGDGEDVDQLVGLIATRPNFGGQRWWMICPQSGSRVAKLYMPPGAKRFASRHSWNLGYFSQQEAKKDRTFEKLCRLQKKLGCEQIMWGGLQRPKGMHRRTFERHLDRYRELDCLCTQDLISFFPSLRSDDHD
jgi:hypothetical protein